MAGGWPPQAAPFNAANEIDVDYVTHTLGDDEDVTTWYFPLDVVDASDVSCLIVDGNIADAGGPGPTSNSWRVLTVSSQSDPGTPWTVNTTLSQITFTGGKVLRNGQAGLTV